MAIDNSAVNSAFYFHKTYASVSKQPGLLPKLRAAAKDFGVSPVSEMLPKGN
jgi:hypothetical protein